MTKGIRLIRYFLTGLAFSIFSSQSIAQSNAPGKSPRPKLVVGIVVDQMRWDYLYRYMDRYSETGFKRLLKQGFSCDNAYINYIPSATAVGHSTVYTGTVPAIHGITGNTWIERATGKSIYCTRDITVKSVGTTSNDGRMSPRNLLASTIGDELRISTNFRSKVVGISLKDRASILPAGHNPTAAFWFDDDAAAFISSTYYMEKLPEWVDKFNSENRIRSLISKNWNTLYPINTYKQSTRDDAGWERRFKGKQSSVFPHEISEVYKTDKGAFRRTPFGNTLTLDFASHAIDSYKLGQGESTDLLAINCASTDYVGHMFGPNSIEVEDTYLRLDRDLGAFFESLDKKLGKGNYLVFLTADHGAANSQAFNKENKLPNGMVNTDSLVNVLNVRLKRKFGTDSLVTDISTNQVYFNYRKIDAMGLDFAQVKDESVNLIRQQRGVAFAFDIEKAGASVMPEPLKQMVINSYNFKRSGDIIIINEPGFNGPETGASHGSWNPFDVHIPLLFMGWGVNPGKTNVPVNMTDIAPTIAALLNIQMPSGNIGKPISEVLD